MLPKPWFRKSKKAWYLQVSRRRQKYLGKTKAEADAAYRAWLLDSTGALPPEQARKLTVAEVGQQFLDHCRLHTSANSYDYYRHFVKAFVGHFGGASAADIIPPPLRRAGQLGAQPVGQLLHGGVVAEQRRELPVRSHQIDE